MATVILNFALVRFSFAGRVLLDDLTWEIQSGQKIGLIGANGSGKTTLLRLILGELSPESGALFRLKNLRIGYLAQEPPSDQTQSVLDTALGGSPEILRLRTNLAELERKMGEPSTFGDSKRLANVIQEHAVFLQRYEAAGGLTYENRVRSTLRELGFSDEDFERPMTSLSGGEAKLVGLARLLVWRPDILLLDEPDNHLDVEGKRRIETLIAGYPGAVIIVSHDRYLLDQVVDRIAELQAGRVTVWPGTYSQYAVNKRLAEMRQEQLFRAQQKRIAQIEEAIRRFELWASVVVNERHARQARARYKMLERMERVERPLQQGRMQLELGGWRGSKKVLEIEHLDKTFSLRDGAEAIVLAGLNLQVWHGERVGLVGPNGAGKTVLLNCILAAAGLGDMQPDGGVIRLGPSVRVGYYAQQHEPLHRDWTLLQEIRDAKPMYEADAYGVLGRFLFDAMAAQKFVWQLSGGERSRLQLAKLTLQDANFLLLDEPTNNLDIPSAEILEAALEDYRGSVLVVSHDRYFLDRLVDRVAALEEGRIVEVAGGYSDYLNSR